MNKNRDVKDKQRNEAKKGVASLKKRPQENEKSKRSELLATFAVQLVAADLRFGKSGRYFATNDLGLIEVDRDLAVDDATWFLHAAKERVVAEEEDEDDE